MPSETQFHSIFHLTILIPFISVKFILFVQAYFFIPKKSLDFLVEKPKNVVQAVSCQRVQKVWIHSNLKVLGQANSSLHTYEAPLTRCSSSEGKWRIRSCGLCSGRIMVSVRKTLLIQYKPIKIQCRCAVQVNPAVPCGCKPKTIQKAMQEERKAIKEQGQ